MMFSLFSTKKTKSQNTKEQSRSAILEKGVHEVAQYMQSDKCKHVVLMLGAGVSTSAGIPDFRSPKTGLYANLARLNLPHPEAVFEISFFKRNPVPFYTLAHELYPGNFRPTLTHSFIRLLSDRGLLQTCFTQNIDTLERLAGVPDDKIIEAHGSFASQRCIECKTPFDDDEMRRKVDKQEIPRCESCHGLVKPDIVFFGESLPEKFTQNTSLVEQADLLIVIGTSLTVHPFASLHWKLPRSKPRVLINLDRVGDFGRRPKDIVLLGQSDSIVSQLAQQLGWHEELTRLWEATAGSVGRIPGAPTPTEGGGGKRGKTLDKAKEDEKKRRAEEFRKAAGLGSAPAGASSSTTTLSPANAFRAAAALAARKAAFAPRQSEIQADPSEEDAGTAGEETVNLDVGADDNDSPSPSPLADSQEEVERLAAALHRTMAISVGQEKGDAVPASNPVLTPVDG